MFDHTCIQCNDSPALHRITITREDRIAIQYVCSYHYQQVEDPKKFFSLLETPSPAQSEELYEILID